MAGGRECLGIDNDELAASELPTCQLCEEKCITLTSICDYLINIVCRLFMLTIFYSVLVHRFCTTERVLDMIIPDLRPSVGRIVNRYYQHW